MKKKMKLFLMAVLIVVIGAGVVSMQRKKQGLTPEDFEMVAVERGDVVYEITASGKIQPINTITVGTQVSGIIEQVLVDYNDEVKEGQLLAMLDTAVLVENKNDAAARLELAKAKERIARLNYSRIEKLFKDKLVAKASLEEAEIALEEAKADVLTSQAEYNKAERNFGYASITSPVSGTIISKEVEEGQTVAASLSTPTLFTLAEDLSKMQIEASVAEADIGAITTQMPVTFTVDAYPNDRFPGIVRQVRLSPTEESNVVMYTVVIEVDNSSRKLLPGMTASVTVRVAEVKDVLTLPTMAFQYKPSAVVRATIHERVSADPEKNEDVVYLFENGRIVPRVVKKGLADLTSVEIQEGLNENDEVILEAIGERKRSK